MSAALSLKVIDPQELRSQPKMATAMAPWQTDLIHKVNELHQEAFEKRTILTRVIQELPQPKGVEAVS